MDFDIAGFIEKLDNEGLFDESTLIVISADHSCPLNNVTAKIPGHPRNNLSKMPLVFLSKRSLPETGFSTLADQTDIAPTIAHILGIAKPHGYWVSLTLACESERFSKKIFRPFMNENHRFDSPVV